MRRSQRELCESAVGGAVRRKVGGNSMARVGLLYSNGILKTITTVLYCVTDYRHVHTFQQTTKWGLPIRATTIRVAMRKEYEVQT